MSRRKKEQAPSPATINKEALPTVKATEVKATEEQLPIGTFPTSKLIMAQCPPDINSGEDCPLASIPISKLMENNQTICPICGKTLPVDIKEVILDGQTYYACKKCAQPKVSIAVKE